jgi:CDP-diacylglycerol--serine O-phosphatidyltransferase
MRRNPHRKVAIRKFAPAIPGIFTFGNLLCGFLALLHTFGDKPESAAWFIFIGAFLDAIDGRVARITKCSSDFGIQFDTLADFLTFGVAPVALMHAVGLFDIRGWKLAAGILYLFAAAFRLARFNVDAKPEGVLHFKGLPTPIAAIAVASGILFINEFWPPIHGTGVLGGIAAISWLMVSNVRYPKSLPKWNLTGAGKIALAFGATILILALILFPIYIIYPITLIYIFHGLIRWVVRVFTNRKEKVFYEISSEGDDSED